MDTSPRLPNHFANIAELGTDSPIKYVVVTGGSMSGLGKGVTVSSLGSLLSTLGLRVTAIKIDPYLNVDAGTMSPYEHGEVFVLSDGGEVDLDLGNYERSFGATMTAKHNLTTGKIYTSIISAERQGDYLGKTVQMVPHVTALIKEWITNVSKTPVDNENLKPNICLIEVGGTVGDIESAIYLEAMQELRSDVGRDNFVSCHLSYIPTIGAMNEQKTKPTQHSTKELFRSGLAPDFILCRSLKPLYPHTKVKLSTFCPVSIDHVISLHDVSDMNEIPLLMAEQKFHLSICNKLRIPLIHNYTNGISKPLPYSLASYENLIKRKLLCKRVVKVGIVGKYTGLADSYLSVIKALEHACLECLVKLEIIWIESTDLEASKNDEKHLLSWKQINLCDAIVCPGGFGDRGIRGKSLSSQFCREHKVPYLGICLGLQTSIIDIASEVLQLKDADSEEFNESCENPVIISMPEYTNGNKGGTMRLGSRSTHFVDNNSLCYKLYDQQKVIQERHRHRYEVNPKYIKSIEGCGLKFVGKDETGKRMQIAELVDHPFYVCTQFHPEFKSRPMSPAPIFLGLILAALNKLQGRLEQNGGNLFPGQALYNNPVDY